MEPRKIIFEHRAAPGDTVVATAAIKALHESQPGRFLTDFHHHFGRLSPVGENVFANNPYITPLEPGECETIRMCYGYGIQNCGRPRHFLDAFVENLSQKLGVYIELRDFRPDIWLSPEERAPWPGLPERYAVIDAGHKRDFVAKHWSTHRYQQVVNATKDKIAWVQIGSASDVHSNLDNVINLVGQTNLRQLIQVIHRSALALTPVSLPMHLAAGVPSPADGPKIPPQTIEERHRRFAMERMKTPLPPLHEARQVRPCVVLMGVREPRHWEAYPGHVVLGTTGKLKCGVDIDSACWRNKTVRVRGDNDDSVCFNPLQDEIGQYVPECLHRVTVEDAVNAVESYL